MNTCWLSKSCKKAETCNPADFCIYDFKMNALCDAANLTQRQRQHVNLYIDADGSDLEAFKCLKNIELNIETFVNSGESLYIHSTTPGNGKTAWSLRLLISYLNKIWYKSDIKCRGLFLHVPSFFLDLKDNISTKNEHIQYIKENIQNADLVIFDEIGTKSLTQFEFEHLLSIINTRINIGKANIYTSNLNPDSLLNAVGDRLYSRIVNESTGITFVGADKRGLIKES